MALMMCDVGRKYHYVIDYETQCNPLLLVLLFLIWMGQTEFSVSPGLSKSFAMHVGDRMSKAKIGSKNF